MNENREHCKRIALELEACANGDLYKCPNCGEVLRFSDLQPDPPNGLYCCLNCLASFDEGELETFDLFDFFHDAFDIEYRVGSDKEYRSVRIMVAFGGPNIYIDTRSKAVELNWWTEHESFPLSLDAVEAVDEWASEAWGWV